MRLKKLEIFGFKSFADKVEIVFDDGITGIVGPNGSGKSNISDAVRWVLGEQSAKMLRGAKMEDVIFNGTEKRRRLSYCEVTLTFDNSDGALSVDFAEAAITRRAYRSGESEYFINRAPCRLKDIVDLFHDTGIGRDGYSLIGQGRIDDVLSARSEDRRQVFEEAAGIVKYKARRREAEKRLENTRANLARVEDILTELVDRLEPLRLQSEIAREYLSLSDELKGLELNEFLLRSARYEQRIKELRESAEGFAVSLAEAEESRERLNDERQTASEALAMHESAAAELRDMVQELIRDTEARDGAVNVVRERLAGEKRERERLKALAEANEGNRAGLEKQLEELVEKIAAERGAVAGMQANATAVETDTIAAEREADALEEKAEAAKRALIEAMNRASDTRSMQSRYTAMLDSLTARREALIVSRAQEDSKLAEQREDERLARDRMADEERVLNDARARSAAADELVHSLSEKTDSLGAEVNAIRARRADAVSRLKFLKEMQRDYDGYQNAVRQVLTQARRMPAGGGVMGAVAELLRVPERFERAVDMALGASLQNVVVRAEEDAKRMIAYLRDNRLGRATFLPLSAVRGRTLDARERNCLKMPGCFGVASELIGFDPEYADIARFLLGRTVIAENLDRGIPIMRAGGHAFRLVTLEGDVMNPGGSMTGGSVQSRMTSLLSREREIAEHEKLIADSEDALVKAADSLAKLEEERARVKKERGEYFDASHRQEVALSRQAAQCDAAAAAVAARLGHIADIDAEMERVAAQSEDVRTRLAETEKSQGNEEQRKSLGQAEITAMQSALLNARSRAAALRDTLTAARVELAARQRDLKALETDAARLTSDSADLRNERSDAASALTGAAGRIDALEAECKAAEDELATRREELLRRRDEFRAADAERALSQKALADVSDRSETLRVQTEAINDKKARCDVQLARIESEYKQLCDRIWQDYELTYAGAEPFRNADFRLGAGDKRIAEIRKRIREMGPVHVGSMEEYRQTSARVDELTTQRDDLTKADADLCKVIDDLTRQMARRFTEQFNLLNDNFKNTFVAMFGGGQASLMLTDPSDPLGCDIEIKAQPPGKKLTLLSLLSGGERALTAIAILFAMLKLKPTPFCFLDEIEAALDDANIDNFAEYLRAFAKSTQFVVVTHRKGTMERCDSLYGVAMEEKGVTRMVSVRLGTNEAVGRIS